MKLDIIRAWKDEAYRQTLSEEQLNTLPANPAGELSDSDLETVSGGWFGGGGVGGGVLPCPQPCPPSLIYQHNESYGLICEVNVFSIAAVANIGILGSAVQNCAKG